MEELIDYVRNYHDKKIRQTPTCDLRSTEELHGMCTYKKDTLGQVVAQFTITS